MPTMVYEYEIPDPARPIPESERGVCGPSGPLIRFNPLPAQETDVFGRRIDEVSTHVGTYGMGRPGFFGLRLSNEWLVVAIWGASDWMLADGRLVTDSFYDDRGRPRPWIIREEDELSKYVLERHVAELDVGRHSLKLILDTASSYRSRSRLKADQS